jgi:hypothetical protein
MQLSGAHIAQPYGSFIEVISALKPKLLTRDTREVGLASMSERSLSDWLSDAGDTLDDRGMEYGDPRHNLLRIYKIARLLGIQLRDPADVALVFIATKLSRMVESPEREDSYLDLIGYAAILGRCRFSTPEDWDDVESDSQS